MTCIYLELPLEMIRISDIVFSTWPSGAGIFAHNFLAFVCFFVFLHKFIVNEVFKITSVVHSQIFVHVLGD